MRFQLTSVAAAAVLLSAASAAPSHLAAPLVDLLPRQSVDNATEVAEPGLNSTAGSNSTAGLRCATSNGDPVFPGMYREPLRPQIHHSVSSGFSNDPNGLIRVNDTWHLYYQYNPNSTVAGNQHWGHSTSPDLLTWTNEPIALAPERAGEGIFSGSAVIDVNNTSGLFGEDTNPNSRIVLMYTLNTPTLQDQHIAYGDGYNFTKFPGPVITEANQTQFRDPKVNWNGTSWIVALAHTQVFQVTFYSSPDLKNWTELSRFSSGLQGYQYECPGLEKIRAVGGPRDGEMLDMLLLSNNPGAPLGGSVQQAFIGDFTPEGVFVPLDPFSHIIDWGKDLYAAQTFYNAGPEAVMIAWAGNWDYAQQVPTANATSGWRSEMTLARTLTATWQEVTPQLSEYRVSQLPYDLSPITGEELAANVTGNTTVALRGDGAFNIQASFSLPASSNFSSTSARLRVRSNGSGNLTFGANFGLPVAVYADRRKAGIEWADENVFFTDRFSNAQMPLRRVPGDASSDYIVTLQVVVDRIISELFVNNGSSAATVLTYWDNDEIPAFVDLEIGSPEITLESFSVTALNSTWDCPA